MIIQSVRTGRPLVTIGAGRRVRQKSPGRHSPPRVGSGMLNTIESTCNVSEFARALTALIASRKLQCVLVQAPLSSSSLVLTVKVTPGIVGGDGGSGRLCAEAGVGRTISRASAAAAR